MNVIWINGKERKYIDALTVMQLTEELCISPATLIEHNGKALHHSEWSTTLLQSGDRVELLYLTAGG